METMPEGNAVEGNSRRDRQFLFPILRVSRAIGGSVDRSCTPAPDVLLLRPAIINVRVTAPDIMSSAMDANFITSAGSGTFYLELWAPPHTLLARALDAQADQQPFAQQANSVTNMEAADIILKKWADDLVRHLDSARGKPPSV